MKLNIDVLAALAVGCLLVTPLSAQQPTRPLLVAADRLNAITPQAVARQTIRLGTYDGATKIFTWALEPSYPPTLPDSKKQANGGDVAPFYYADVNSYSVTYEIEILNRPPNLTLSLLRAGPNGQTIASPASISGGIARVDVSAPSSGIHTLRISSGPSPLHFYPRLANQLGAFVVPYLLVSIIYEPPGAQSKASYSVTTTAGSAVTLGVSRSSGFITEPAQTDTLMWVFNTVLGIYIQTMAPAIVQGGIFKSLLPKVAAFLEKKDVGGALKTIFEDVGGVQTNAVQFIVDTTVSSSRTQGYRFSITEGWETRPNDQFSYPGNGDVFFILQDVVFLYVAYQGKVYMAPVAYAIDRGLVASELPPDLALGYVTLDPNFRKGTRGPVIGGKGGGVSPLETGVLDRNSGYSAGEGQRFRRLANQPCDKSATKFLELTATDYQILSGTRAVTNTRLERATGLVAMGTGTSGTTTTSVTYSSASENYTSTSVAPRIEVACEGQPFEIEVFFDNLFGTFLTRRGPPLTTYAALAGQANDAQGRPRPNQLVSLTIGDRSYRVRADANGSFAFPFATIPTGSGTLSIGNQSYPVSYAGSPKRVALRGDAVTEEAAAAGADAPITIPMPGEVRTGKPASQPTPTSSPRPRRP